MFRKIAIGAAVGVASVGAGAAAVSAAHRASGAGPLSPPLPAAAFNARQDPQRLAAALAGVAPGTSATPIRLYRLQSCPYCARVQALLDFHRVPYSSTVVDPILWTGMPRTPYGFVPQMQFVDAPGAVAAPVDAAGSGSGGAVAPSPEATDEVCGPMIVDSAAISAALARRLGRAAELDDPRVQQTREFVSNIYGGLTFSAMADSLPGAWRAFPGLVPAHYNNAPCRAVGSVALYGLASLCVAKAARRKLGLQKTDSMQDAFVAQTDKFIASFPPQQRFHGGKTPDLADIDVYGVLTTCLHHSDIQRLLKEKSNAVPWLEAMQELMPPQKSL